MENLSLPEMEIPHKKGSFVVGQYVERLGDVMDGKPISPKVRE
jgi:hypothetical protein